MGVRTTITLDDDVAKSIERLVAERGERPKEVVNSLLRLALRSVRARRKPAVYKLQPVDLGRCLIGDVADVSGALAAAEGDRFR